MKAGGIRDGVSKRARVRVRVDGGQSLVDGVESLESRSGGRASEASEAGGRCRGRWAGGTKNDSGRGGAHGPGDQALHVAKAKRTRKPNFASRCVALHLRGV